MTRKQKTQGILYYVHFDVCMGTTRKPFLGGSKYFMTSTNGFSCKVWVYFLKYKYEVFTKFKLWKREVENQQAKNQVFMVK